MLTLSRYVASMISHLKALEARAQAKSESAVAKTPSSASSMPHFVEVHGSIRFVGKSAPAAARLAGVSSCAEILTAPPECPSLSAHSQAFIDQNMHDFLVGCYVDSLQGMYPILHPEASFLQKPISQSLELSSWEIFALKMVYSIACHCMPANDTRLLLLSEILYKEATIFIEEITAEQNVEALQTILLLALRSQFDAQKGSIGQQIAFAHRLEIELTSREADDLVPILQRLRHIVFCLSVQMTTALDRPSALPTLVRFIALEVSHWLTRISRTS